MVLLLSSELTKLLFPSENLYKCTTVHWKNILRAWEMAFWVFLKFKIKIFQGISAHFQITVRNLASWVFFQANIKLARSSWHTKYSLFFSGPASYNLFPKTVQLTFKTLQVSSLQYFTGLVVKKVSSLNLFVASL